MVVDISKDEIDKGEGYVDCFEYLKWYLNNNFEKVNPEGYLDRYTVFHWHHKLHWPHKKDFKIDENWEYFTGKLKDFINSL